MRDISAAQVNSEELGDPDHTRPTSPGFQGREYMFPLFLAIKPVGIVAEYEG